MTHFEREQHTVQGNRVVLLTAGSGTPLLFLHGAGTFHGFEFALPWAERRRVIAPFHPGWGESGDAVGMTDVHDYVMHYLELLDQLKLDKVDLVGFSLGGLLAARFAAEHGDRVRKLVLVAPAGLRDDKHPTADVLALPPEKLLPMLAVDFSVVQRHLPAQPDANFMGERYREATATSRLLWERPWDPKLQRYLHRLTMPTLLVWGQQDALIPVQQSDRWLAGVPGARLRTFDRAGHLVLDEKPEAVRAVAEFLG